MPRSGTFLEATISYYSHLAFDALETMRTTQEDLRTNTFQVSKAIGKAVSLWLDATEGWWSALLVTASEPLPTVFLRIGSPGGTVTREVRVLVPAQGELGYTDLMRIKDGKAIDGVSISLSKNRDGIEVKLKRLDPRTEPGLYLGLVHVGDKPLAIVMVRVDTPDSEPSGFAGV